MRKFRKLPLSYLPYKDEKTATRAMLKFYEATPFLASLTLAEPTDGLLYRTLMNIPGIDIDTDINNPVIDIDNDEIKQQLVDLDVAFNSPNSEALEPFGFYSFFLEKYCQIVEKLQPKCTVIHFVGPFSISQMILNKDGMQAILDKYYRKVIIQAITVKALWIIDIIKMISPETVPIIIFEEPLLHKVGYTKRENESITTDIIINMLSKVISKIHEAGAKVGVQCFEKCDWQIPIEAGTDIISFDAYNNPNNLNIIADKVNDFLAKGGVINWAILPLINEEFIKTSTIDSIYSRLTATFEGLINSGTSAKLTYNNALISTVGDIDKLPLIFAEKALILLNNIGKKIPVVN